MKKRLLILAVGIALLGVVSSGWWTSASSQATNPWLETEIDRGDIPVTVTASGIVEPLQTVQIGSQVSGRVDHVLVEPDQEVKVGDVLALLDRDLLESDCKDKEEQLENARISLDALRLEREDLDFREQQLKLETDQRQAQREQFKFNLDLAAKNLERCSELLKRDVMSQNDWEARQKDKQSAQTDEHLAQLDLCKITLETRQLKTSREKLDSRERQIRLAISQAEQALAKAKTNLAYASIVAPIDGIVLERDVQPGQTIVAQFQAPNLFTLSTSLEKILVRSFIDEADIGSVHVGQEVQFEVDAYRGEKFSGRVKAVHLKHEVHSNLVTYPVIIEAENPATADPPHRKLRPGMTAFVTLKIGVSKNVLRVPTAALKFTPPPGAQVDRSSKRATGEEGAGMPASVFVKGEGDALRVLTVRLGGTDGQFYELISGPLTKGDKLVTALRDGGGIALTNIRVR